ncbi:MAG: fasciclin domain-containing protein [Heteroscytonema crispum UTEX LB 1556]
MNTPNLKPLISNNWFKRLACVVGIAGATTLISVPVLAKFYPRYALFQPSAYSSYPYRNSQSTIAETLAQDKDAKYVNLVYELKQAGLLDTLNKAGTKFTIFAPTDKAFNALPKESFKKYSEGQNRQRVLKYHLVPGVLSKETIDAGAVKTLEGSDIKIAINDAEDTVKLNDAHGKHPSTVTSNGVIIEVDKVLLPPDF